HHIFENQQTEKNLKIEDEAIQRDNVKLLFKPALGYTAKWRRTTWNIELFGRISPHEKSRESFHQTGIRLERIF
ncbi:MAG: hypothetical protein IT269_05720, partial [Saprospiraceae bacterium]|nr:hypothetical protein [Saprospiraceae bacterium]